MIWPPAKQVCRNGICIYKILSAYDTCGGVQLNKSDSSMTPDAGAQTAKGTGWFALNLYSQV